MVSPALSSDTLLESHATNISAQIIKSSHTGFVEKVFLCMKGCTCVIAVHGCIHCSSETDMEYMCTGTLNMAALHDWASLNYTE